MRGKVWLDGGEYDLYQGSWTVTSRPSQASDGMPKYADWRIDGPQLYTIEDTAQGEGYLGVDYGDNVDTRWWGIACLGPLISEVDLSTYDPTWTGGAWGTQFVWGSYGYGASPAAAPSAGMAITEAAGTVFGYVTRGRRVSKVDLVNMTLVAGGTHTLPENATSILATRTDKGVQEVSVGMRNHAYQTARNFAASPNPDDWAVNAGNVVSRIIGQAADRVALLGKADAGVGNKVAGVVLSGSVTMRENAGAVNDISTIGGKQITMTGFAQDGDYWVIGTSDGPYSLDANQRTFFPVIPEIHNDIDNCKEMVEWYAKGVLIPTKKGLRYLRGSTGRSIGIEKIRENRSAVGGYPNALEGSESGFYAAWYNPATFTSWLIWFRDYEPGDPSFREMQPFVLMKRSSRVSFIDEIGDLSGLRTTPAVVMGLDSNTLGYFLKGETTVEIDDSAYRFASTGTLHLTEMRRYPGMTKDLEAVEFESDDCTANLTLTFGVSVDGAAAVTLSAVTTDAQQRLYFVSGGVPLTTTSGKRIKPQVAFATNSSSASPKIVGGKLRLYYRVRPAHVDLYSFTVVLRQDDADGPSKTKEDALIADLKDKWVHLSEGPGFERLYVKVEDVKVRTVDDRGGGKDTKNAQIRVADVRVAAWPVGSGQ